MPRLPSGRVDGLGFCDGVGDDGPGGGSGDDRAPSWAGARLAVRTSAVIKRRGIVVFRHDLVRDDDDDDDDYGSDRRGGGDGADGGGGGDASSSRILATGEMTCFFIRADDGRSAAVPDWTLELLRSDRSAA